MNMRRPTVALLLAAAAALGGCAPDPVLKPANVREFSFERDVFAFSNDLKWRYKFDPASGERKVEENPDAEYALHCFVLARSARQFYQFARFAPEQPRADEETYRGLVREVVAHDPAKTESIERVVIPGYANLRAFSADYEAMLKDELGSPAESYLQRGNWRIAFPFPEGHQEKTAENLLAEIRANRPPLVHLIVFPEITINHAVMVYDAVEKRRKIVFRIYDPNDGGKPAKLTYDLRDREFTFPKSDYFPGGKVSVYEIYKSPIL